MEQKTFGATLLYLTCESPELLTPTVRAGERIETLMQERTNRTSAMKNYVYELF